jgi:DNA helicase-2/ATP-dependent DNA helicase PcrA
MAIVKKIMGPPGTGKTYRLVNHYLKKELNEYNTDPEKIAYITFSRSAAEEAEERIAELFLGAKLKYISTMHAMGMRESNIDANTQLLTGKKWNRFKQEYPEWFNISFETTIDAAGNPRYQNTHLQIIQYSRSKLISIEDSAVELQKHHDIDVDSTIQLQTDLKSYKEGTKMIEFYDMINKFVEEDRCPPLDVIFLDEAQDLSPHQWKCFDYIKSKCKRAYMAGDDDQTIYGFQGADPNYFMQQEGERDDQEVSRRVPKSVHREAVKILNQLTNRIDKKWIPRDAEGMVYPNYTLDEIDFSKGNWMILARTNKLLLNISEHFYFLGVRFTGKTNKYLPNEILEAYQVWTRLNQGASVSAEEAQTVYQYLLVKKGHVARGFSNGKTIQNEKSVDIEKLKSHHGLLITGDWKQLNFPADTKDYMQTLLERGDDLMNKSKIQLMTLHGSKGRECENVCLFPDYGTEGQDEFIYRGAYEDPDPEHRLFFVGATRAKENLYLMQPTSDYYYTIGGPIV